MAKSSSLFVTISKFYLGIRLEVVLILVAWWMLSLTGALAPGPLSAAVVMQASRGGRLQGIMPMVGHAIVELGIVVLIVMSVSALTLDALAVSLMQGIGGVAVIAFGMLALRDYRYADPESATTDPVNPVGNSGLLTAMTQGVIVSILSPYFLLWWFAVGMGTVSTLVVELQLGVGTVILAATLIYFTHISTDFMFGAVLTVSADETRRRVVHGGVNWLNVGIGVFQVVLGLWFIVQALTP